MIIKIDIDGVLRDFPTAVYRAFKILEPDNCTHGQPLVDQWNIAEFYPRIDKFWDKVYYEDDYASLIFGKTAPCCTYDYDWLSDLLRYLDHDNTKYMVFSHQKGRSIEYTYQWLEHHYPQLAQHVYCAPPEIKKSVIPGVLIDDKVENILYNGVDRSILVRRPWNKNFTWTPYELTDGYGVVENILEIQENIDGRNDLL